MIIKVKKQLKNKNQNKDNNKDKEVIGIEKQTETKREIMKIQNENENENENANDILIDRLLREEQDIAFQEALLEQQRMEIEEHKRIEKEEKDKQKEIKRIEREKKKQEIEERKKEREQQKFIKLKEKKQKYFELHPQPDLKKGVYTLKFKVYTGDVFQRRFHITDKISLIMDFLISNGIDTQTICVETTYPKHKLNDPDKTLEEYNICSSTLLHVLPL